MNKLFMRLEENENQATAFCGCVLEDNISEGSGVRYYECATHTYAFEVLSVLKALTAKIEFRIDDPRCSLLDDAKNVINSIKRMKARTE